MAQWVIEGGTPLNGRVSIGGNKNAALPLLAASLLAGSPSTFENMPRIGDVGSMLGLLVEAGAHVRWIGESTIRIEPSASPKAAFSLETFGSLRGGILLAGPLAARLRRFRLPWPGGDAIGQRGVTTLLDGLSHLGIKAQARSEGVELVSSKLQAGHVPLREASVTATETALMVAATLDGETTISNAAREPHVVSLCAFLQEMGAGVDGVGTDSIVIRGTGTLRGGRVSLPGDHIEAGSWVGAFAATRGRGEILGAASSHLDSILEPYRRLGIRVERRESVVHVDARDLRAARPLHDVALEVAPWPGLPSDLLSILAVVATQVPGTTHLREWMYDARLRFLSQLQTMGARIVLHDPHRASVSGPNPLQGSTLTATDIRAGMALTIAALTASGTSAVQQVEIIERGYEAVPHKLRSLGARLQEP